MSINRLITSRIKKFLFIQEINELISDSKILLNNSNDILQRLVRGNYRWYKIEEKSFPGKVSLIILDGRPGKITGSRTGIFHK